MVEVPSLDVPLSGQRCTELTSTLRHWSFAVAKGGCNVHRSGKSGAELDHVIDGLWKGQSHAISPAWDTEE
jgi:hypothetical protein